MTPLYSAVLSAKNAGLCVLPVKEDGSKAPDVGPWAHYQRIRPDDMEIQRWFADGLRTGMGFVCGEISGGLEVLDFDDGGSAWDAFEAATHDHGLDDLWQRIKDGYHEITPTGGHHVYFRSSTVEGAQKLAQRPREASEQKNANDRWQVLIETRGEGGFIVSAPSHGAVHASGGAYMIESGGPASIVTISEDEREDLLAIARLLDEKPRKPPNSRIQAPDGRPGDALNAQKTWEDLLLAYGWTLVHITNGVSHWRRPGKERGVSATTNYGGSDLLWVFTTSTELDANQSYDRFGLYTAMEHGGDFHAAAKALRQQGHSSTGALPAGSTSSTTSNAGSQVVDLNPIDFPIEILPNDLRAYVQAAADSLSVPVEMVAIPMIVMTGALIGNRAHIKLKATWWEYPTLYHATVAPPGSAKTPALNLAKRPLSVLQRDAHESYREQNAAYQADLERWNAKGKAAGDPKPTPPGQRHLFSTDLTIEALAAMLGDNPGVAIIRDEISGWIASLDQYRTKGSDRQQYLTLWSGQGLKVDRKSAGSIYVPTPVIGVLGGIQPDLVGVLHNAEQQRDGFVERVLPTVVSVGPTPWTDTAPTDDECDKVLELYKQLDALPILTATAGGDLGIGVNLSHGAKAAWVSWFNENAESVKEASGLQAGFYAKLPAHVARFALILHALWNPRDPRIMITEERMADAIELGEFFRHHIGLFLDLLQTAEPVLSAGHEVRIMRILRRALAQSSPGWVSRSTIIKGLRNVPAAVIGSALDSLAQAGRVERRQVAGRTKPTEEWRLVQTP